MRNLRLDICYDGSRYKGWQRLPGTDATIQGKIEQCLSLAQELLDVPTLPRSGYYAFVCEKCAPTFDYYGWFFYANELKNRAEEIYERA